MQNVSLWDGIPVPASVESLACPACPSFFAEFHERLGASARNSGQEDPFAPSACPICYRRPIRRLVCLSGMVDIARQTVEFLYEENGGIPRDLYLPTIEDIKDEANKFTIDKVRKGTSALGVAIGRRSGASCWLLLGGSWGEKQPA